MATFVIVHGGFGGGWEWTPVARALRVQGHIVFTPTLTGMGERVHLGPDVGLAAHVQDVVATVEFEDLDEVILCGASYGGMPVTGAADRVADRIRLIVYVDALVPADGQSALDLLPDWFGDMVRAAAGDLGHGWVPIPPALLPPQGLIPDKDRERFIARLRDQPATTFTDPIHLTGAVHRVPRAFVRCTAGDFDVGGDPIEAMAVRARTEGWLYRELSAPHDPHLFDPAGTAAVLHELAATASTEAEPSTQIPQD